MEMRTNQAVKGGGTTSFLSTLFWGARALSAEVVDNSFVIKFLAWSYQGSNPQPTDLQCGRLPLGYVAVLTDRFSRRETFLSTSRHNAAYAVRG